ncbi:gliding motility-associated C-terminal domain-containing protein [Parapedobacter deserti]|uniref:Gliding motility-associated C-terminal domain-containing protein n=1 Tax=Parapedobacter deserti TaxID=1912957 RepID=A0ABV7JP38_9SPHI
MQQIRKRITILTVSLLLIGKISVAQPGKASATYDNSKVVIDPGTTELIFSEGFYLGPESDWEVNGTLEVWSKFIWIAPTARLHGTGTLIIHGPGDNLYYEGWDDSPTYIDGNDGEPLAINIELRNPHNLVLQNIAVPEFDSRDGVNPEGAGLHINGQFSFGVDNGDIMLNGYDLRLGASASFSRYNQRRMIVTGNSVSGHVIKDFPNSQPFVFPVGISEGDYTPATLAPSGPATMYVSVQDYAAAGIELADAERGMDRIWHIYASQGVQATYTLQHNSITNGTAYVDAEARIVQYAGGGNWIGDVTVVGGEGIHTRADIMAAAGVNDQGRWLTKLVDGEIEGPQATDDVTEATSGSSTVILILENDAPGSAPIDVSSIEIVEPPRNGTATVNSDGSITYVPVRGFMGTDVFVYQVSDLNGLVSTATVTIVVAQEPLRIPNVFTPNGDGRNDVFEIQGMEAFDRVEVTVVNRWGNEVYRSTDYKNDWNGGSLNEGTYYYVIKTHKGSEVVEHKGWVLIKRL